MLEKIKSSYFIKMIFSFLIETKKLNLVKYNKALQNEININIMNYKVLYGRYIIYEKNGIGKEYNIYNDALMFVGEYIKGIKNGKGKEYQWNNLVVFEGEYLNGKINGKGKEYNYRQDVIFEGEYLNGFKNGKGKEYYYNYPIF